MHAIMTLIFTLVLNYRHDGREMTFYTTHPLFFLLLQTQSNIDEDIDTLRRVIEAEADVAHLFYRKSQIPEVYRHVQAS